MAIVPDGGHPGIQQVKNLVGLYFGVQFPIGSTRGGIPLGLVNWGSVWGGDKCGNHVGVGFSMYV